MEEAEKEKKIRKEYEIFLDAAKNFAAQYLQDHKSREIFIKVAEDTAESLFQRYYADQLTIDEVTLRSLEIRNALTNFAKNAEMKMRADLDSYALRVRENAQRMNEGEQELVLYFQLYTIGRQPKMTATVQIRIVGRLDALLWIFLAWLAICGVTQTITTSHPVKDQADLMERARRVATVEARRIVGRTKGVRVFESEPILNDFELAALLQEQLLDKDNQRQEAIQTSCDAEKSSSQTEQKHLRQSVKERKKKQSKKSNGSCFTKCSFCCLIFCCAPFKL